MKRLTDAMQVLGLGLLLWTATSAMAAKLIEVTDVSTVCMVTNRFMGMPQIPVTVESAMASGTTSSTYYGCCQGCIKKVQDDEGGVRHTVDPQTGAIVDKAKAVIARDAMGQVFYFKDHESLRLFNAGNPR